MTSSNEQQSKENGLFTSLNSMNIEFASEQMSKVIDALINSKEMPATELFESVIALSWVAGYSTGVSERRDLAALPITVYGSSDLPEDEPEQQSLFLVADEKRDSE